jgi:hypothetical protein
MAWFGTEGVRLASLVSKGRRYRPVESGGGHLDSDGAVAPGRAVVARLPREGATRRYLAGNARSNYEEGRRAARAKLGCVQDRLWAAANQSRGRRFHALYDGVDRRDVLRESWEGMRANRGAAGVDGLTLAVVEAYGVQCMPDEAPRKTWRRHLPFRVGPSGGDPRGEQVRQHGPPRVVAAQGLLIKKRAATFTVVASGVGR